jgi:hypothetical protein
MREYYCEICGDLSSVKLIDGVTTYLHIKCYKQVEKEAIDIQKEVRDKEIVDARISKFAQRQKVMGK